MSDILNSPQMEAVRYVDGPLLVLAGAGSGKTRVITHKIAHLVSECGFKASEVAAITFTNKASREMQERISGMAQGQLMKGVTISTFHALGMKILRAEAQHLGLKSRFSILDADDAYAILAELTGSVDKKTIRGVQWKISSWKNALVSPDEAETLAANEEEVTAARAYRNYDLTLRAYQATDFDDLILLPVRLFSENFEVLQRWQSKLRYFLVDEYQDTNGAQYRLLRLMCGDTGRFTAVGDDDQAIYAWRGANVENLRTLQTDYPRLKVIKLEQNYRSTVRILKAANALIANNPKLFEKRLWSDLGFGDAIQVTAMKNEEHEAESVVMRLGGHKFQNRTKFSDYAILYRGNHQARVFEQYLRNERIPYRLSGGQSFFDKAEIKDLVAYLRLIVNADDDPAFIRAVTTPRRGIGAQTLETLGSYAGERNVSMFTAVFETPMVSRLKPQPLAALTTFCNFVNRIADRAEREPAGVVLADLLAAIDYQLFLFDTLETRDAEGRWDNVQKFVAWLSGKGETDGKSLLELTQTVALMNLLEGREEEMDAVQLTTIHAAKGLEFPYVFLVGAEEGILPHQESVDGDKTDEERRLMYVAITRARNQLFVSHCLKRRRGQEWRPCEPSRFINEMGADDLHFSGEKRDAAGSRAEGSANLAALKALLNKPQNTAE
ncbi:MAG TPA: UvrD-helicase domain-containing protein [Burkholderiales bacterium]|nr:UvrD-helicase domain-containing protein [Burkholderiales bacterium]